MRTQTFLPLLLALAFASTACGDDDGGTMDAAPADGGGDASTEAFTLNFGAMVGDQAFACGTEYTGIGSDDGTWTSSDMRFYVHGFELLRADGSAVSLTLDDDGMWQNGQVALLDFEDGCGEAGNAPLNTSVRGTAPAGTYTGVRFSIGVPEALNHANAATAGAPLNLTSMFWNWNGGYKFVRIEGPSDMFAGWRLHLGSTMCDGDMMGNATCGNINAPQYELTGDLSGTITFDVAALFADSPLTNTDETPPGCMSAPTDTDCAPIFEALGLDFGGTPGNQTVFSIQ